MNENHGMRIFIIIWIGYLLSEVGSGLTAFSLGVYAFHQTGLATSTSMVVLSTFFPAFLMLPFAGVFADSRDRTFIMMLGNFGSALGITMVYLMIHHLHDSLWLIYPGIIISSIFFGLQHPSYKSCITDFLPKELYAKASGLVQLSSSAQFLIAPMLAGLLLSITNIKNVLAIDIATFIISAATIIFIRIKGHKPERNTNDESSKFMQSFRAGIKFLYGNKPVFILTLMVSIILFYIGLIQSLLGPMVLSFSTPKYLGVMQSLCAVGMLASSLAISTVGCGKNKVTSLCVSLLLMGLCFSFIGVRPSLIAVVVPGLLFFATIPFVNSCIEVLIRSSIPNIQQGRVWSMISVITYFGAMLAYAISGFLADHVFNPLLTKTGKLASSLGYLFGVGQGRGIAFMFFISGIFIIIISVATFFSKNIRSLGSVHEDKQ